MRFPHGHLAYCTNIHPAEDWKTTFQAISTHAMKVRDLVAPDEAFAIGLRLSSTAAKELLRGDELPAFNDWLATKNAYVFTINGFPYGDFRAGSFVKRNVFRPDWADPARLEYTKELFTIVSQLLPEGIEGSVSTLPGSFKEFQADESAIRLQLIELATFLDSLAEVSDRDLHLGMEPEPRGHFENTEETLRFFDRLLDDAPDHELIKRRIGINYDCCHFALQYESARDSLTALRGEGLRISKIHLSAALALDPRIPGAVEAVSKFDEPTFLHQVLARHPDGRIERYTDLPEGVASLGTDTGADAEEWRVHFHIPLDAEPAPPLASTRQNSLDALALAREVPDLCQHWEIETYTWGVLPQELARPVEEQIAGEYRWVLAGV
ncbi:metabolite traffic protein EboE [Luteolibacter sp. GHJ8]|uniref:Metabolite traffic protein EboE n=1 Tax=Luteolibacter rhizosphaerae TaxID=2989719 RepID=A0ABT3G5H1_9BACT|nr:metabolite traffic protein EboE [Luteolibacter rhizosphaerae]MCW1915085.1 metabolite traffic protein EboE [Luteolibacter rhizosphaerae]